MKQFFPLKQVMGFILSLLLTVLALLVYFIDMPFEIGMAVLILTAFIQAALQLAVFMHAGETQDKGAIYSNVYYALIIALSTIFGTVLSLIWGYM